MALNNTAPNGAPANGALTNGAASDAAKERLQIINDAKEFTCVRARRGRAACAS
jgi:hypothetical protein